MTIERRHTGKRLSQVVIDPLPTASRFRPSQRFEMKRPTRSLRSLPPEVASFGKRSRSAFGWPGGGSSSLGAALRD